MELKETVKELAALNGTSGDENDVREYIINRLPEDVSYKVDGLGNLIVEKMGNGTSEKKLMIAAHMDEVGFMVTHIEDSGELCFGAVGGVMPAVVFGRQLVFKNGVHGAVAGKPLHLLKDDENDEQPKLSSLRIDIGAKDREEAENLVSVGDCAYFTGEQRDFGDGFMSGKALDDRAGCGIMLRLINGELPYDCTFVFTVQEEIGTRGAKAAAFSVNPDLAMVIEATTACDISGTEGEKRVCELGKGPVISYMDKGTIYDKELYRLGFETAKNEGIPCQTKSMIAGGNDSGAIHTSAGGVRTMAISVPCRYLHSPCCVIKEKDLADTEKLVRAVIEKVLSDDSAN